MSREMLFMCDVYDAWLDKNNLPHWSADDILYGENACKLTGNQKSGQRVLSLLGMLFRSIANMNSLFTAEQIQDLKREFVSSNSMKCLMRICTHG